MTTNLNTAVRPGTYTIDPARSTCRLVVAHVFGLQPVDSTMAIRGGTVTVATDPSRSTASAELDATTFRTDEPRRDKIVRSRRFLDADHSPTIAFRSTGFTPTTPGPTASGSTASGSTAAGQVASGSTASGQVASGSTASGSTALGSTASGSTASGPTASGPAGAGGRLTGVLSVRGQDSPVIVELGTATATADGCHFEATCTLDRVAAGVRGGRAMVGRTVRITLDLYVTA